MRETCKNERNHVKLFQESLIESNKKKPYYENSLKNYVLTVANMKTEVHHIYIYIYIKAFCEGSPWHPRPQQTSIQEFKSQRTLVWPKYFSSLLTLPVVTLPFPFPYSSSENRKIEVLRVNVNNNKKQKMGKIHH